MTAFAAASAILALVIAAVRVGRVLRADSGGERLREIAGAIREGTRAFLAREYAVVAIVAGVIALGIAVAFGASRASAELALAFLLGAAGSALAGVLGVLVSVQANVRTAAMAVGGDRLRTAKFAFGAGNAIGFGVVGLAMLELVGCYVLFHGDVRAMAGVLVGASLLSLFARVGGGIYTKGADIGADLVGKLEAQIPEDDPRNPAVIADNVGDNVGDCAGMAADLFETFLVTAVAAMVLGSSVEHVLPHAGELPLAIAGCGVLATIVGAIAVNLKRRGTIDGLLYRGIEVTLAVGVIALYVLGRWVLEGGGGVAIAMLVGPCVVGVLIASTHYYTSPRFRPVENVIGATRAGAGPVVIAGLSVGLRSVWLPGIAIASGALVAFFAAGWTGGRVDVQLGLYGIGLAGTSMLAMMGMIVSIDAFGPVVDNAGGMAEMADLPDGAREVTDALDVVGNTTKAITKGYAIGSAALAALALFAAYTFAAADSLGVAWRDFSRLLTLDNPLVVVGLLVGALLPFVFASLLLRAVGIAATAVVFEVRRQFAEVEGLAEGRARPLYGRCVAIVTSTALRQLIAPGALSVAVPLVVGFALGPIALSGVLIGVVLSGFPLAVMMTTSGASWDNAKKDIEQGHLGGKRSPAHGAAIVGDTVGDALKDAAGPAINPLVKVVNTVALLCVGLLGHA